MRTLRYRLVEIMAGLFSHRTVYRMNAAKLRAFLERDRPRRNPGLPHWMEQKYIVCAEKIEGRPLYILAPKDSPEPFQESKATVLFLHGGGFIHEAHSIHWQVVARIIDTLGCTVWVPAYPLFSGKPTGDRINYPSMRDINEMIRVIYDYMLDNHKNSNIVVLGDSAGAALALTFCHHNKATGLPRPMPHKLILVSPGMLIEEDPAVRAAMRVIGKKDTMLSLNLMAALIEVLEIPVDPADYYVAPLYGDFSGFPAMEVFSGTRDLLYPQAAAFAERVRGAGVPINFHTGQDMMHIWPYMPAAPECRAALEEIIGIISQETLARAEDSNDTTGGDISVIAASGTASGIASGGEAL